MYTRYADQSETCSFQILQINSGSWALLVMLLQANVLN
jgi:hypothetical protein